MRRCISTWRCKPHCSIPHRIHKQQQETSYGMAAAPNLMRAIWKTISDTATQSINNKLHLRQRYTKLGIRNLGPYLINSSFVVMLLRAYRHKVSILPQQY